MGDRPPLRNPTSWFLDAAVVLLAGAIALTIAIHLLVAILPWLLAIAGSGLIVWIVVVVIRYRRQRW